MKDKDSLRFSVRSHSSSILDVYLKHLFSVAFECMKDQKGGLLSGLHYDLLWTCPICIMKLPHREVSTFSWDPDEKYSAKAQLCDVCNKHVDMMDMQTLVTNAILSQEGGIDLLLKIYDKITSVAFQVNEIPGLVLKMATIQFLYLFQFISTSQYGQFYPTTIERQASDARAEGIMTKFEEAQQVLKTIHKGVDLFQSSSEEKTKRFWKYVWSKITKKEEKKIYLQLLNGKTFLPLISYEIKVTGYSERMKHFAKLGADMVAIGMQASVVWNVAGKLVSAFGILVPRLENENLDKIQSFFQKLNEMNEKEPLSDFQDGEVSSALKLDAFGAYLNELDTGTPDGKMCHLFEETDPAKMKEKT